MEKKIKEDQILAEVETAKAVVEVPSPRDGIVIKLHYKEGECVKVGEVLVTIGDEEDLEPNDLRKDKGTVVGILEEAKEIVMPSWVLATPAVRRKAKEMGIDIALVKGTGHRGKVTEEVSGVRHGDDSYGPITRIPIKGIRKTLAKNLPAYQHTAAHVTHMDEADVTELIIIKEKEEKDMEEKGIKLTFLPFIIKAVIIALKAHPFLNSTLDEDNGEIILKKYYNIGIAVDTKDGLIAPIIKDADKKNIISLAEEIKTLSERARSRTIDIKELRGGTFSITNVGAYGGVFATPIINYPEAAILATGRIQDRPVVIDMDIRIRKILPISITFDHRIMDGAMVARFTNTIIKHLEDPGLLLLELR